MDQNTFVGVGLESPSKLLPEGSVTLREEVPGDYWVLTYGSPPQASPIWFKVTKWKDQCFFELSNDNQHWRRCRSFTWKAAHPPWVGFVAAANNATNEQPFAVQIEHFAVWTLKRSIGPEGAAKPSETAQESL